MPTVLGNRHYCLLPPWQQHLQHSSVSRTYTLGKSGSSLIIASFISAVDDALVIETASKLGKTPAQVLIGWAVQRGTAVLPKSVTASRIQSNFEGETPHGDDNHL